MALPIRNCTVVVRYVITVVVMWQRKRSQWRARVFARVDVAIPERVASIRALRNPAGQWSSSCSQYPNKNEPNKVISIIKMSKQNLKKKLTMGLMPMVVVSRHHVELVEDLNDYAYITFGETMDQDFLMKPMLRFGGPSIPFCLFCLFFTLPHHLSKYSRLTAQSIHSLRDGVRRSETRSRRTFKLRLSVRAAWWRLPKLDTKRGMNLKCHMEGQDLETRVGVCRRRHSIQDDLERDATDLRLE